MHVALLSVSNELVVPNSKIVTWPNTKNPDCQACLKPANTILRRENHCFWMLTRRCPRHAVRNTSLTQHKCSAAWPRMWSLAGLSQIYAPEPTSPTLQYRDRARSFPEQMREQYLSCQDLYLCCKPRQLRKKRGFLALTHMQQPSTRLPSGEPPGLRVRV